MCSCVVNPCPLCYAKGMKRLPCITLLLCLIGLIIPLHALAQTEARRDLQVSATVPAQPSHFQLALSQETSGSEFAQDKTIEYKITYGSHVSYEVDSLTIIASWDKDAILSYIVGSAANAHNNTPPVINTVNKTITWSLTSFPGSTINKTVFFKLKTSTTHTTSDDFEVKAQLNAPGVTKEQSLTKPFKHKSTSPTSTPTPAPTTTTTPTPTPTPRINPFAFTSVGVQTISQQEAQVSVSTTLPSSVSVSYGASQQALTKSTQSSGPATNHSITLSGLSQDTVYYFRVRARAQGRTITSDTFTLKTARVSELPEVDKTSIIITSNNTVLTAPSTGEQGEEDGEKTVKDPVIVLPPRASYVFRFKLVKKTGVKRMRVIVRSKKVLGIATFLEDALSPQKAEAESDEIEVIEIEPGVFTGKLIGKTLPGDYEVFVVTEDDFGNITEEKVAALRVTNPFTVLRRTDKKPIEGARIELFLYNPRTKNYDYIAESAIAITNPSFTDNKGELQVVLPVGKYKARIADIGYRDKDVFFTIGQEENDGFPIVLVDEVPITVERTIRYYVLSFRDVLLVAALEIFNKVFQLSRSIRFFDLVNAFNVVAFILVTFVAFIFRTHISLKVLPRYIAYTFQHIFGKNPLATNISGKVIDRETNNPVSHASIYVINTTSNAVLGETKTNKNGLFHYNRPENTEISLMVVKEGYEPVTKQYNITLSKDQFVIHTSQAHAMHATPLHKFLWFLEYAIGFTFEAMMLLSVLFEFLFVLRFGLLPTLPFIFLSALNLSVWLFYQRVEKAQK